MSYRPWGDIYNSESGYYGKAWVFEHDDWEKGYRFKPYTPYEKRRNVRNLLRFDKVNWDKCDEYKDYLKEFSRKIRYRTNLWDHTKNTVRPMAKWQYYQTYADKFKDSNDFIKRNKAEWYQRYLMYLQIYPKKQNRWTFKDFTENRMNAKLSWEQIMRIRRNKEEALFKRKQILLNKKK